MRLKPAQGRVARGETQPCSQLFISQQLADSRGDRFRIGRRNQNPVLAIGDDFRDWPGGTRHARATGGHCFDQRDT